MAVTLLAGGTLGTSRSSLPHAASTKASAIVQSPLAIEAAAHGLVQSANWSGYAVTYANGTTAFSNVGGSWVEPTATCSGNQQQDASFWVGIDGFQKTAKTVEQIGTDSDCNKATKKVPGGPTYYAWWELYPKLPVNLSSATFPVTPGDTMTASVVRSGGSFTLTIQDITTGRTFSAPGETPTTTPAGSSAEWIAESPTSKLADFGIVSFFGAAADGAPINSSSFVENQIDMTKGKKTIRAATSPLIAGTGFNVTWRRN
jgi:hypothetical protein